jgi:CubicO group peptidase (beta-lactamase class C family)
MSKSNVDLLHEANALDGQELTKEQLEQIEKYKPASFIVTQGDCVIYEKYWGKHNQSKIGNSFSMAKSITALLVGVALEDGSIKSIDDPVANYLDEFKSNGKDKITIRHMLTMSSGLSWNENYNNPFCDIAALYYDSNTRDLTLNKRLIEEPSGVVFKYKSADTQTLMYILEAATQQKIADYTSEKIWKKIGAETDALWGLIGDINSEEKSFCCVYASSRDYAKLGRLINQNGCWNGEQMLNEDFVKLFKSLAPLDNDEGSKNLTYGFQHWIYTGLPYKVSYCRGILGQYIISIPEFDLVIVRTGSGVGKKWKNTKQIKNDPLVSHRVELPEYIGIAMDVVNRLNKK